MHRPVWPAGAVEMRVGRVCVGRCLAIRGRTARLPAWRLRFAAAVPGGRPTRIREVRFTGGARRAGDGGPEGRITGASSRSPRGLGRWQGWRGRVAR